MANAIDALRRFIVARQHYIVTIREVEPGACAYDMSREEAWTFALKLAEPATRAQVPALRQKAEKLIFIGNDGEPADLSNRLQPQMQIREIERPAPVVVEPVEPVRPQVEIPAGRYAVTGNDGTTDFYALDRPTEGKWKGYTFLNLQVSDERIAVKNRKSRETILAKIGEDVQGAMLRYGQEIGRCGHCNRTLTNEASRAKGIGPVCEGKMGW